MGLLGGRRGQLGAVRATLLATGREWPGCSLPAPTTSPPAAVTRDGEPRFCFGGSCWVPPTAVLERRGAGGGGGACAPSAFRPPQRWRSCGAPARQDGPLLKGELLPVGSFPHSEKRLHPAPQRSRHRRPLPPLLGPGAQLCRSCQLPGALGSQLPG